MDTVQSMFNSRRSCLCPKRQGVDPNKEISTAPRNPSQGSLYICALYFGSPPLLYFSHDYIYIIVVSTLLTLRYKAGSRTMLIRGILDSVCTLSTVQPRVCAIHQRLSLLDWALDSVHTLSTDQIESFLHCVFHHASLFVIFAIAGTHHLGTGQALFTVINPSCPQITTICTVFPLVTFPLPAMGKHYQPCACSMFPDGHLILKADRMKHHLELEQVRFWSPLC